MKPLCAAKQPLLSFLPTRWNRKRRRDSGFHWLNEYPARGRPVPGETERVKAKVHHPNETVEERPNRMTPLRRPVQPMDVAHAVLCLASDEASNLTGHT